MSAAIYMWDAGGLNVLIPKRRGNGFLRTPMSHHFIQEISDIEVAEKIDIDGLDGYLALEYGYTERDARAEIVERVMPKLAQFFGFITWREEDGEFWSILLPAKALRGGGE